MNEQKLVDLIFEMGFVLKVLKKKQRGWRVH